MFARGLHPQKTVENWGSLLKNNISAQVTLFFSPTDSPNTFLFLHTPQMFPLYAWLAHLIISNPPRQFPNNVSFIRFLYFCTLQCHLPTCQPDCHQILLLLSLCLSALFFIVRRNCLPVLCLVCLTCIVSVRLYVFTHCTWQPHLSAKY